MCIFKIGCFSLIANKELTILKKNDSPQSSEQTLP